MKSKILMFTSIMILSFTGLYADKKPDSVTSKDKLVAQEEVEMPSAGALALRLQRTLGKIDWKKYIEANPKSDLKTKQDFAFHLGSRGADAYFLAMSHDTANLIATSAKLYKAMNKLGINDKETKKLLNGLQKQLKKSSINDKSWRKILSNISTLKDIIKSKLNAKYQKGDKTILYEVGGWIEGYRLAATAIKSKYSKNDTTILGQKDLITFLLKELKGNSKTKSFKGYTELVKSLESIKSVLSKAKSKKMTKDQVNKLVKSLASIKSYM